MRSRVFAAVAAFVAMEPVTYATHRWIMHRGGWEWHRSHHQPAPRRGAFEKNDLYPVSFAGATIVTMAAANSLGLPTVMASAVGVTAYGAAYELIHDLYIHQRLSPRPPALAPLEYLRRAHALHHADGGEPYGMLLPIVPPKRMKAPAATTAL